MPKYIAIIEGKQIKKYYLGKIVLPMTVVRKHLYRTDERFFFKVKNSADSIMFTELESTQAYGSGNDFIDPDDTIAFLDTAPNGGNKSVGYLSAFANNPMLFIYMGIGIVIVITALGRLI